MRDGAVLRAEEVGECCNVLTTDVVDHFVEHGYAVVPLLSSTEASSLRLEILSIVEHRSGIRPVYHPPYSLSYLHQIHTKISNSLSSTGGAGGVMDIHFDEVLDKIRTDSRIWEIVRTLWLASYGSGAEGFELPEDVKSAFDFNRGYCTIDR